MQDRSKIIEIIFSVIEEMNEDTPDDKKIELSEQSVLFGKSGKLDSLGLVNLIVAVEQKVDDDLGVTISLTDEKAMSQKNSPFLTVTSLVDYIQSLLSK